MAQLTLTTDQPCELGVYHTDGQSVSGKTDKLDPLPKSASGHDLEFTYQDDLGNDVSSHYLYFKPDTSGSTSHKLTVPDAAKSFVLERTTPAPRTTVTDMTQVIDTTTAGYAGVSLWCYSQPGYSRP